jgi:carbohydrate-binding DOMON domain-containing protein
MSACHLTFDVFVKSQDISLPLQIIWFVYWPHWITLDHIGSHWPGVATEAAGCSTSVPLRTRPSRWMTLLHFARLFFEVIVKRATYTATWRLVRSDE